MYKLLLAGGTQLEDLPKAQKGQTWSWVDGGAGGSDVRTSYGEATEAFGHLQQLVLAVENHLDATVMESLLESGPYAIILWDELKAEVVAEAEIEIHKSV